ncbi:flagellar hook-length control protein FliK [Thiobacillus sp.]
MFPVQVLARILDVPPKLDSQGRPLSGLVPAQPVLNATERDQAAPRAFEAMKVGQILTGLVKALDKGISMVEIAGQTVAMRLPHPAGVGDTLRLRFAGHMPQAVFVLEPPGTAAGDDPQLSQTARMLSDIMQRVPDRNALPTLTPPGPLLGQPATQVAELALALRTALVRSGLFYESHLANWTVGLDSLDGLMQEPQNRLATAETARTAASAQALLSAAEATGPKPLNPMHALLTQQLQVLESPQFAWRGEVWPGQELDWQLRRETDPAQDHSATARDDETQPSWESKLRLTLPRLGTLTVHIRLDARQAFSIRMVPEQAGVEPLLLQNQGRLIEQLTAAGCTLQAMTVVQDHAADA